MTERRRQRRPGALKPVTAALFLAPAVVVFTVLHIAPFLGTIALSTMRYDGLRPPEFIGLGNYASMAAHPIFWTALRNNVAWYFGEILVATLVSLVMALMVNSVTRFKAFYRTTLFLPVVLSWSVVGMLWSRIYNPLPQFGLLNGFLKAVGLDGLMQNWLGDAKTALASIIVSAVWKGFGFNMVIFLAGLQSIPEELIEASKLDGANWWRSLWHVTLPGLRPITAIVLILGLINTFKVFDPVWVMTQGGPGGASHLIATLVYTSGMSDFRLGYSSALSIVLMVCAGLAMGAYFAIFRGGGVGGDD